MALPSSSVSALAVAVAAASTAFAQDGDGGRFRPSTPLEQVLAARFGDHHIAVVGEDLITRDEVLGFITNSRDFEDPADELPPGLPQAELEEIRLNAGLRQMIERQLEVQGGRNQGYEPELLQRIRDNFFEQRIAALGGESKANRVLSEQLRMTPNEFRDYLERRLLSQFWEDSVTGRSVGPTGRQFVDPFVRPGVLYSSYRNFVRSGDLELGEIVGKEPERVALRRLVIAAKSEDPTTVAEGERLARALRDNIETDVIEFDDAVNQYAPTNFRGDQSRLRLPTRSLAAELADLHPTFDAETFVRSAPTGTLSPVLRVDIEGVAPFFVVYELEARIAPKEADAFLDLELQERLRESIEENEADIRVARGLGQLVRRTYVAPEEIREALVQGGRRSADRP